MVFGKSFKIMRRVGSDLFLIFLLISMGWGFVSYFQHFFGPMHEKIEIDLSLWHLPQYTFFSLSRGLSAYALSLVFSLAWGFWAAKDKIAEKILIPFLDVLQSIPFLGFLPGVVLLLVGIFQHSNVGLRAGGYLTHVHEPGVEYGIRRLSCDPYRAKRKKRVCYSLSI